MKSLDSEHIESYAQYASEHLLKGVINERIEHKLSEKAGPADIKKIMARAEELVHDRKPALVVKGISKRFGNNEVLENVHMNIKRGELIGIIGLSGSGKTTLLNCIMGFHAPEEGGVSFHKDGKDIPVLAKQRQMTKVVGFAPQDPSFYRRLTVRENLDHFGSLFRIPAKERQVSIKSLLRLVGLEDAEKTLGGNLSGGMQRRLGIACALIHDPDIVILDEPTADLDPLLRKEVYNLINQINDQGKTVVLTSHFLSEVEGLCHRIAILNDKSIVAYGTPDELKINYSKNEEVHLELASGNYGPFIKSLESSKLPISKIGVEEHKLVVYTPQAEKVLHNLVHLIERRKEKILDIELNKPSLNEVFESFVRKPTLA